MNYRNLFTIFVLLTCMLLAPAGLRAQTYQEMDAEAYRVRDSFWQTNYQPMYAAAAKEFNAGNYEQAIAATNRFLAYIPDAAEFLALRGRAYNLLFQERIPPASSNFSNSFENIMPLFRRGQEDFLRAIELDPKNKSYEANFGWLLYRAGYAAEAVAHFDKALALDPQYWLALNGKANAVYFTGDFRGCVEAVGKYMTHAEFPKEDEVWTRFRLGECYASLGDKANAKQNYERAIALQPGLEKSWLYLAFLKDSYKCQKPKNLPSDNFESFAHLLGRSLCPQPTGIGSLAYYEAQDENLKFYGMMHLRADKKLSGNYIPGDRNAGIVYYDSIEGSKAGTVDFLTKLEDAHRSIYNRPKSGRSLPLKLILEYAPDALKMLAWAEQAKIQDKENIFIAHKYRGRIYSELKKNYQAASKEYAYAATLGWTDYELFLLKGRTHLQLGEPEAAYEAFQKALEFTPRNPIVHAELKQFATNYPQFANRVNQGTANAVGQAAKQAEASQESALITEYNNLAKRIPDLERQQRGIERKVSDYMNAGAAARVFMYRGVYNSINSVISSHESFITSFNSLRNRAADKSPAVVSQIDSQIRSVKSAVDKLHQIRSGLPIGN